MKATDPIPHFSGETPENLQVFGDAAQLYAWSRDFVETISDSYPDSWSSIHDATLALHDTEPNSSPLRASISAFHRSLVLGRAANGVASRESDMKAVHDIMFPGMVADTYITLKATFDDIIAENDDAEELNGEEILENRSRVSKYAIAMIKMLEEDENWQNTGDFVDIVHHAYFATLLSGKYPTYEMVHNAGLKIYERLSRDKPELDDITIFMDSKQDKAHLLAKKFRGNAQEYFDDYSKLRALKEVLTFTHLDHLDLATIKERRDSILRYAKDVILNEEIREAVLGTNRVIDTNLSGAETSHPPDLLDYEVLPPGKLTEAAKEIVEATQKKSGNRLPEIDLGRLEILENIRKWWGEDRAYYAKGVRTTRRAIRDESGNEEPDQYVLLILQHRDENGNVTHEDAVAESPIAGPNALYIQRYDVNHWDWRELMAYPKADTRSMGARQVKHNMPEGSDLITAMTSKVIAALKLSPEDFLNFEFSGLEKNGSARLHIPRRVIDTILSE